MMEKAVIVWPEGNENWSGGRSVAQQWGSKAFGRLRPVSRFSHIKQRMLLPDAIPAAPSAANRSRSPNTRTIKPIAYQSQPSPNRVAAKAARRTQRGAAHRLARIITRWSRLVMNPSILTLTIPPEVLHSVETDDRYDGNSIPVKRLDFIFFDAGGGHRSAAIALKAVIDQQQRPWEIRLVNLQDVLDCLDIFRKYTGIRMQDIYNKMLKKGLTLGSGPLLYGMHGIIRLYHGGQVRMLSDFWSQSSPDLVVSLVPNFNRAMYDGLRSADAATGRPPTPMVTILTDLADHPPHFWIEKQDQYFVCGSDKAVEQAHALGHGNGHVFKTSGMILRPKFYEPPPANRDEERIKLGLNPDLPTGLVLFGGEGSQWMAGIAKRVSDANLKLQLICICGRNQRLREEMQQLKLNFPMFVEGFTSEVPYYMYLSDFFIGKPGPGSISEALAMQLPVIVERNAWTLVQERYNTEWIEQNQVGIVLGSFNQIADGLRRLLEPHEFQRFRTNAAAMQNRAVFEIPEILNDIMLRKSSQVLSLHQS